MSYGYSGNHGASAPSMFEKLQNAYEWAPVPLRVSLAALFAFTGIMKVMNVDGVTQYFTGLGFPAAQAFVWLAIILEVGGAVCLLLGLWTRITAMLLSALLVIAIITGYLIPWDASKLPLLMNHWPMLGATLALVFSGPGKWSLDEKFFWE